MAHNRRAFKNDKRIMKFIPYGHQWLDRADVRAVEKTLHSDWITQGPIVRKFEKVVADYCGVKYVLAVSSGTAALHLACLSLGIKSGDEVITTPITFVATANSVLYCGGKPVFADIQDDTININPKEIEKKITKKTKAIIPVHFAGHPVDLEDIYKLAKKHKLIIIEDACHALGAMYKDTRIGSCKYSDLTVFSFHPVKHITTGEGGMILTNKRYLYEKLLLLRNHGITKNKKKMVKYDGAWYYEQQEIGFNYRITDFQCALGLSQMKKLDYFLKKRREIVKFYNKELSKVKGIILPIERDYVKSSWHLYYIRLKDITKRKRVFEKLRKLGIGCQVHYVPVHLQPYYRKKLGYKSGDYPIAEKYYKQCLSIPLFPRMSRKDMIRVVKAVRIAVSG